MKETKKIIFLFILVLSFQIASAQFDGLQINLEFSNLHKKNNLIRFSLYKYDSSLYCIGIKRNPIVEPKDYKTWLKQDADTIIIISKEKFNMIAEMCMNLSSSQILKGMNPSNPGLGMDGYGVDLELVVVMDKITYNIWSPSYNTKERNLEPFLAICKEILLLAKMKPKDYF